jgi:hypothetical protein
VAGGAGYIGSHVVHRLRAAGRAPVVVDSLVTGHRDAVPEDVPFLEADVADRARVAAFIARHRVRAVLHFAALSQVGESVEAAAALLPGQPRRLARAAGHRPRRGRPDASSSPRRRRCTAPRALAHPRVAPHPRPSTPTGDQARDRARPRRVPVRLWPALRGAAVLQRRGRGALRSGSASATSPSRTSSRWCSTSALGRAPRHHPRRRLRHPRRHLRARLHPRLRPRRRPPRGARPPGAGGAWGPSTSARAVGCSVQEVVEAARRVTGHPIPGRPWTAPCGRSVQPGREPRASPRSDWGSAPAARASRRSCATPGHSTAHAAIATRGSDRRRSRGAS